jgi:hypothetical protein
MASGDIWMSNCTGCGDPLETGAQFCSHCGQRVDPQNFQATPGLNLEVQDLRLGGYLSAGWELFKQYPGGFVGFTLVFLAVHFLLGSGRALGGFIGMAVSAPLGVGFFVVAAGLVKGRTPVFQDFFAGFRFFLPLLLLSLVSSVFIVLGFILLIIPGVYLLIGYTFAPLLVVDRGLDFWPAMELSRRTVQGRWFSIVAFVLVLTLINLAGILCLGAGLLVTIPVSLCAWTAAYREIFGFQSDYSQGVPRFPQS